MCDISDKKTSFKRKRVNCNARKKVNRESSSSEDETTVVKNEKVKKFNSLLAQSTSKTIKDYENINSSDENVDDKEILNPVTYKSSRVAEPGVHDSGATSSRNIDTDLDRDAETIAKRAIAINKDLKGKADDKVYRGMNNYQQLWEKKDSILGNAGSNLNRVGPMRASSNVRSTVRWDYNPAICKDYLETGYCGFGDSCKWMHDRSDYKHGWQIERELEAGEYGEEDTEKYEIDSDGDDDLPFKCFLCRNSFQKPVVTKCKHYFCEKCALDHYQKKSKRCFVCGTQTMGVFNPAKVIEAKLKKEAAKLEKAKEEAEEESN